MTEEEAKTKWCPYARGIAAVIGSDGTQDVLTPPHNRVGIKGTAEVRLTPMHMCIGSACMAWRWDDWEFFSEGKMKAIEADPSLQEGFCGLAGGP